MRLLLLLLIYTVTLSTTATHAYNTIVTSNASVPSIALCAPTISGCVHDWEKLPFLTIMLPTFLKSIANDHIEYRYTLFLGYDEGDPLYDDENTSSLIKGRVAQQIEAIERVEVIFRRFIGMKSNTVAIWNSLCEEAYDKGFDWFYMVNDDVAFNSSGWADIFIKNLSDNEGFGVASPKDHRNMRSMTHSFVGRQHLDLFDGKYFPPRFKNWFSDDWITHTYAYQDQFWLHQTVQVHNMNPCVRPRYAFDRSAQSILTEELEKHCIILYEKLLAVNDPRASRYRHCNRTGWWDRHEI